MAGENKSCHFLCNIYGLTADFTKFFAFVSILQRCFKCKNNNILYRLVMLLPCVAKEDVASSSLVSRSIKKRVSKLSFLLSIFVGNPWVINVLKLKHKTVKLNRKHVNLK